MMTRLNALRGIISEINQQASSSSPIKTDMQVLALLRKRKAASQTAAKEAEQARRDDLKQKQDTEIGILDEYAGSVKLMSTEDLRSAVKSTLDLLYTKTSNLTVKPGTLMKELLRPGGRLEGEPVDKAELAKVVQDALQTQSSTT